MGCDGACAAGTAILAIAVVAPVLLWLSALVCVD